MRITDHEVLSACQAFGRLVESGRTGDWAHAYLVESDGGDGARYFAKALALAINCTRHKPARSPACGECEPCRRTAQGGFPALVDVWPIGAAVTIGQVQAMIGQAALRYPSGITKVFVVHSAERMRQPAANALLKTLEEPPERTVFVLDTAAAERVLPTVRSRCRQARICLPGDDELFAAVPAPEAVRGLVSLALTVAGRQPQALLDLLSRDKDLAGAPRAGSIAELPAMVKAAAKSYRNDASAPTPIHALLTGGWFALNLTWAMAGDVESLVGNPTRYRAMAASAPLTELQDWFEESADRAGAARVKALVEEFGAAFRHPQLSSEGKLALGIGKEHVERVLRAFAVLLRWALANRCGAGAQGVPPLSGLSHLDPESIAGLADHVESLRAYSRQNVASAYVFDELFLALADAASGQGRPPGRAAGAAKRRLVATTSTTTQEGA